MKIFLKLQSLFLTSSMMLLTLAFNMSSCSSEDFSNHYLDELQQVLGGEHKLIKIKTRNFYESNLSGSFFIGIGSVSGKSEEVEMIRLSWKLPNNQYAISKFNSSKIRIQFDSTAIEPFIEFKFKKPKRIRKFDLDLINNDYYFHNQIIYVLITCREEDYIIDVDISNL